MPIEIEEEMNLVKKRLGTSEQYTNLGFNIPTRDINEGPITTSYKTYSSMEEKFDAQLYLAKIIRAVNEKKVAEKILSTHFNPDILGNLRKFAIQNFRCVKCNEKYRRPPLVGNCVKSNGRIIFTISEGSIIKYLEPAISLAEKYNLPSYLKQTLELTKLRVESVFGKDKEKQEALGKWF